jgi:YVTN family beta-propeller protein
VDFRILGSLEVEDRGQSLPLGGRQQRALLALLLVRANNVVPVDEIIEHLWGPQSPPSAAKNVHALISKLRRRLESDPASVEPSQPGILLTRPHGYILTVADGELDLHRFQSLLDEGRHALTAGDPDAAADMLRQALALWRGPPLPEFAFDSFAHVEIARLEELRLSALEDRIEADLALGRHNDLIAELEALVAHNPLRERLRGQLMLALYRSGRQAQALDAYQGARRMLVDELGIEPGQALQRLEKAILVQDATLELQPRRAAGAATTTLPRPEPDSGLPKDRPERPRPLPRAVESSPSAWLRRIAPIGALVALAAAGALYFLTRGGSTTATVHANALGIIDPGSNRIVGEVPVGARPAALVSGSGALWVADLDDRTVSRVDPTTRRLVRTIPVHDAPTGLTASSVGVWAVGAGLEDPFATAIIRIDPRVDEISQTFTIAGSGDRGEPGTSAAADGRTLWVVSCCLGSVSRVDGMTGKAVARIDTEGISPGSIAFGAGSAWVVDTLYNEVARIAPTNVVVKTIPIGRGPSAIAVGPGAVWVALSGENAVRRIDPATNVVTKTTHVGRFPTAIAVGAGGVWVANFRDESVSRLDVKTGEVVRTIDVGGPPAGIAVAGGKVWVSVQEAPPEAAANAVRTRFESKTSALARMVSARALAFVGRGTSMSIRAAPRGSSANAAATARITVKSDPGPLDPALALGPQEYQLEYATCAKLVNYPDHAAPAGSRIVPEVARSLPTRSPDGKSYTFRIRPGFRFSPPSNEPVTAQTFKLAIERGLKLPAALWGRADDIVGARAFAAGTATHVAGVVASGDRLTFRLTAPNPVFVSMLAEPLFCAVPTDTPLAPEGVGTLPSAGPYYVASYAPDQQIVLKRNPNYHGQRPHGLNEIDVSIGVPPDQSIREIEAGRADYTLDYGLVPGVYARLARRYGPATRAASVGRQRYFLNPALALDTLSLNTKRPLFARLRMRRAVNYAIDRRALARLGFESTPSPPGLTDQYLPPTVAGFRDARIYPSRPDVRAGRRLARGTHATAVLYSCTTPNCRQHAAIIRKNLEAIGLRVDVQEFPLGELLTRLRTKGEPFDLAINRSIYAGPDPFFFLNLPIDGTLGFNAGLFDKPFYNRKLEAAAKVVGLKREVTYGKLDVELAREAAPLVAFAYQTRQDFFSARMGCHVYQPAYGMDLAALCLRRGRS